MANSNKKMHLFSVLCVLISSALVFVLELFPNYIINSTPLLTVSQLCREAYDFILPVFLSAVMISSYHLYGTKKAVKRTVLYSLFALFYIFPTSYLTAMSAGYMPAETVLLALMQSAYAFLFLLLRITVCILISFLVIKISTDRGTVSGSVAKGIADASPFAFDTPVSRGLLAPCLLMFVYTLVIEIIDTVTFIIDYYDSLRIDEIIYISAKYVFILIYCTLF
jgi:hypothetical protein